MMPTETVFVCICKLCVGYREETDFCLTVMGFLENMWLRLLDISLYQDVPLLRKCLCLKRLIGLTISSPSSIPRTLQFGLNYNQIRPMFSRLTVFYRFCSQITKVHHNSINPVTEHVAFGHYFPKQWNSQFIQTTLDPTLKSLKEVQLILNKIGQPSGKVLLKFNTPQAMQACIDKYNQDFIITKDATHRVVIQPFALKTKLLSKETTHKKTKHQVKVKNLDFDITPEQLERLAKDFGKVVYVEMHIRPNGLNNGLATVYFEKATEAEDFAYFCDQLLYKERKLKAQVIQMKAKSKQTESFLKQPKVTLESHDYVFKKCVAEQKNTHKIETPSQ